MSIISDVEYIGVDIFSETGEVPIYKHDGDAGMDVKSVVQTILSPGSTQAIKTGLYFNIPHGFEFQVRPRSGLAVNHGITVLNSPGTIDATYKGELQVILHNSGPLAFNVHPGDRIAQIVLKRVPCVTWNVLKSKDELQASSRGEGKFGSTGKN